DYLARRDAEWMGPAYESLGLSVGVLQQQMGEQDRSRAYRSDITYGTASEFGFDFLRDRLKVAGAKGQEAPFWAPWTAGGSQAPLDNSTQRPHHFALAAEAASFFTDEAPPCRILTKRSRPATPAECVVYHWANGLAA